MQEINLLQSRIRDTTYSWERQSRIGLSILSLILIILILASAGFYFLGQRLETKNSNLTADNAKLQTELAQKNANLADAKVFQAQLVNLRALLANHIYYSAFLEELNRVTYQKAQFISIDANQDTGQVHLEGRVDSYHELGKFILGLSSSKKFSQAKLLSATPSSGETNSYSFSVDLTVSLDTFSKK